MTLETIFQNVTEGKKAEVESGVQAALNSGISAEDILNKALIAAMDDVGQRFEAGDFFVPEMLVAARAMQAGLDILKPYLAETGVQSAGTVAIGTVKGDLHDIGKNLVGMMLEGAGFEVIDLGTDVDPGKFAEAVRNGANVVGMSALLTTTMGGMADVIEAVEDVNMREEVKIIVGGAPVTPEYAEQIGADGFAADASSAVKKVRELLGHNDRIAASRK
jgi:5-methyltetrahydrofolate--homocysteine methyltransferase